MALPREIQRAQYLSDRLNSAIKAADRFRLARVHLDRGDAEELLQLLADSLRTIGEFDLVEFDGRVKPSKVGRIGHVERQAGG